MAFLVRCFRHLNIKESSNLQELSRFSYFGLRGIKMHVAPTSKMLRKRQKELGPEKPVRRSSFLEWNLNSEIFAFGKRLNEDFKIELLLQAFIHKSYIAQEIKKQEEVGIENPEMNLKDNESLVETGEKIMSSYVKSYLCHSLPKLPLEGIQGISNYLLSEDMIADISKNLGTQEIILSSEYPVENETFARTFKAIVGALYESQGLKRANIFVRDFVLTKLATLDVNDLFEINDPLNVLKDILNREGRAEPEPRLINQAGVSTVLAVHHVGIYCNKELIGQGPGESITVAIDIAARDALRRMFDTTDSSRPIRFDQTELSHLENNLPLSQWTSNSTVKKVVTR